MNIDSLGQFEDHVRAVEEPEQEDSASASTALPPINLARSPESAWVERISWSPSSKPGFLR